jgi:SAM-dependent methyltransferase
MIGFGNAGRAFCKMLLGQQAKIKNAYDYEVIVNTISTRSKGTLYDPEGVDIGRALREIEDFGRFSEDNPQLIQISSQEAIKNSKAQVLIELSTLSIKDGQPAISHIEAAIENAMHVITANKGPIAWDYKRLKGLAEVMADNCQTIYVLDESKGMLAKVKQNSKVKPIIGDALNTNFEKESIDIVTMVDSLHHIDNHPELMKEMHRILKVGGKILILDLEREDIRIKLLKIFEFFLFGKLNYRTSKEVITLLSEKFNVIKHIDKKYYYFILAEKPDLD